MSRVIVFDLGGVLIRICRTWQEAARRAGLSERPYLETTEQQRRRWDLSNAFERGELSPDAFCEQLSLQMGGVYETNEIRRVLEGKPARNCVNAEFLR